MQLVRLILILAAAFVTGAPARADIIEGADALADSFGEVFAIVYRPEGGTSRTLCSATLVHPRVLVTSAHCLPGDPTVPVTVVDDSDARATAKTYASVRTARHASYPKTKNETRRTAFDIGIVILAEDVAGSDGKSGARIAGLASVLNPADAATALQDGVVVVGYGGKNSIYKDATTGTKRWGIARIAELFANAFSTLGPVSGISTGDSGGPAFVYDRDGRRRLFGMASGTPSNRVVNLTGRPEVSLYTGMRTTLACWIEEKSGYALPALPGSFICAGGLRSDGDFGK